MIIRSFKYKDLSGLEREEECYFNLSEAEILELQTTHEGGFVEELQRVIKMQDQPAIARLLKKFILDSYGERSADGRFFYKEDEEGHKLSRKFKASPAYDQLYVELMTNDAKAAEFINGIIPVSVATSDEYKAEYDRQIAALTPEMAYKPTVVDMPTRNVVDQYGRPAPEQKYETRGDMNVASNPGANRF